MTGRKLTERELAASAYAETVAATLGERSESPETKTRWLTQRQTSWIRDAHADSRGAAFRDYWGHYTAQDGETRFMYHVGPLSPINLCCTLTITGPAGQARQDAERALV